MAGLRANASSKPAPGNAPATSAHAAPARVVNREGAPGGDPEGLAELVMDGLEGYAGPLELILSAEDLTAREFLDLFRTRGTEKRRKRAGGIGFS
mgnify:CR=1 FL=1